MPDPVALPDVTLVVVDSVAHALAALAIEDTLRQITPAEVIVWTDRLLALSRDYQWVVASPASFDDVTRILWYEAPVRVRTSHFLVVQWDGWVIDGRAWRLEWLERAYVGAPWWHADGLNVGNGGFSLRSTELARWVAVNPGRYPIHHPEDVALCRTHRRELEADGFTWATEAEAAAFAFERTAATRGTFGFHGAWHWPRVLERDRLGRRLELANDYVRGKPEWKELMATVLAG